MSLESRIVAKNDLPFKIGNETAYPSFAHVFLNSNASKSKPKKNSETPIFTLQSSEFVFCYSV